MNLNNSLNIFFKKKFVFINFLLLLSFFSYNFFLKANAQNIEVLIDEAIKGDHRSDKNKARDKYRNPKETLLFFGLKPGMKVLELNPSRGWYTEIIAPVLKDNGLFVGANGNPKEDSPTWRKKVDEAYKKKLKKFPNVYGNALVKNYDYESKKLEFTEPNTLDMVLTFRSIHNWAKAGTIEGMFDGFYISLKPGGILGVVQHRAKPGTDFEKQINSGYITEDYVIEMAKKAGFKLQKKSEINSNEFDTADHPGGVWNLPPRLRNLDDKDIPKYKSIGESDRMTLKFVKTVKY